MEKSFKNLVEGLEIDSNTTILRNEDPTTCPKCGCRTSILAEDKESPEKFQIEKCLGCKNLFVSEEETELQKTTFSVATEIVVTIPDNVIDKINYIKDCIELANKIIGMSELECHLSIDDYLDDNSELREWGN